MTKRTDENPHTLRAYLKGIDLIPYVAVLALPFAWAMWAMGVPGDATPEELGASWWFRGYLAMLLYLPSIAACGLAEWVSRRRQWPRFRVGVRLFRWLHFLVVFGPIILLIAAALN